MTAWSMQHAWDTTSHRILFERVCVGGREGAGRVTAWWMYTVSCMEKGADVLKKKLCTEGGNGGGGIVKINGHITPAGRHDDLKYIGKDRTEGYTNGDIPNQNQQSSA